MSHTPRTFTRVALTTMLAAGLGFSTALPAAASPTPSDEQAPITWSMSPLPEENQSNTQWVELDMKPGESVQRELVVKNHSAQEATFGLQAADGYFTDTGRFNMLASDEPSEAAGTWISIQEEITVAPKASENVRFTVTVPENATPGDHAAGVASSTTSIGQSADGASLGVESRIGFRVITRVEGELNPSLAVQELHTGYKQSWNPFAPGSITADFRLHNDGNLQLQPQSALFSFQNAEGQSLESGSLLPGDGAKVTMKLDQSWPTFLTPVTLEVTGTDNGGAEQVLRTERVWVWTLPLPQLFVLLGATLCFLGLRRRKTKQTERMDELLDQARRDGAEQARQESNA